MSPSTAIRKYPNRRLYDPDVSRYITQEELTEKIRGGRDVTIIDVNSGEDLTQATLTQMILESRGGGKLLPVPLLLQLLRLGDGMLADFFGKYLSWSLQTYMSMRSQASQMMPWNPLLAPGGAQAFARMVPGFMSPGAGGYGGMYDPQAPEPMGPGAVVAPPPPAPSTVDAAQGLEDLRRELEELKRSVNAPRTRSAKKASTAAKKPRPAAKKRP